LSCSAGVSEPDGERESASEIPSAAEGSSGSKIEPQRAPVRLACARSGQATDTRRCGRRRYSRMRRPGFRWPSS